MPLRNLCQQCLEDGVESRLALTGNSLIACLVCGAVDENATYRHNTVEVSAAFGTLLDDAALAGARFKELHEKHHEQFVDSLLEAYLVDARSRIVDQPAEYFKAGARAWYNRMRTEEEYARHLKRATTNSSAQKVPYRVALAIYFTVQDSNITVINNRLAHLKKDGSSAGSAFHGDGSIMAPSLGIIFPTSVDLILSQVYAMGHHIRRLCNMPWEIRLTRLCSTELKASAARRGITLETAAMDDLLLDSTAWEYMADVNWQAVLETAYQLYCATQVVNLWGSRHSTDYASALLFWSIQSVKQDNIPSISAWSTEIARAYGGNDTNALARRAELKDLLVAWSTSFEDAKLPVPLTVKPRRGRVGDGLSGWGSDCRRSMPEAVMAMAAAPVVAKHWRLIVAARLRCRSSAWPLDAEYTLASKMFAAAHDAHGSKRWKRRTMKRPHSASLSVGYEAPRSATGVKSNSQSAPRSRVSTTDRSRATSLNPTRPSSISASASPRESPAPSVASASSSHFVKSRQDMLRLMKIGVSARPSTPPPQPTIEDLLATHEDSSDDDASRASEDETVGDGAESNHDQRTFRFPHDSASDAGSPFAFSIGPQGFSVAKDGTCPSSATVVPLKRAEGVSSSDRSRKRRRPNLTAPISPPATTPSPYQASPSLSPSLAPMSALAGATDTSPSSLRMMSLSPSPSLTPLSAPLQDEETDVSRYAGLLVREREQYVSYDSYSERLRGMAVSIEVERTMDLWVQAAKRNGDIPPIVTPAYLASLGIHGDPRKLDLGPYIEAHRDKWSPSEALLRAGLRPLEFPSHYVVHSLVDLELQLHRENFSCKLAAEGVAVDEKDLDAELDVLFAQGGENWKDLISTPDEASAKEALYLKQGVWSHGRAIPEGRRNTLSKEQASQHIATSAVHAAIDGTPGQNSPQGSRRINYEALERLVRGDAQEASDLETVTDAEDSDPLLRSVLEHAPFTGLDVDHATSPDCDEEEVELADSMDEEDDGAASELEW